MNHKSHRRFRYNEPHVS